MHLQISDPAGQWFCNRAQFAFFDPESETNFTPQLPTKATPTAWLQSMPMIEPISEPGASPDDEVDEPVSKAFKGKK
jgi:hypothetical protein